MSDQDKSSPNTLCSLYILTVPYTSEDGKHTCTVQNNITFTAAAIILASTSSSKNLLQGLAALETSLLTFL